MLLCGRTSTLQKDGVQEEIGIAEDLVKELGDERFIIPLRLEKYKKLFGIGELQYINFQGSWARGLHDLLDTLLDQKVPRSVDVKINPNWEAYRKRLAIPLEGRQEPLTLNWLQIVEAPDLIRYYQPTGAVNHPLMEGACANARYPAVHFQRGFFSFASQQEVDEDFKHVAKFKPHSAHNLMEFVERGSKALQIQPSDASNMVTRMFHQAWDELCRTKELYEYRFSSYPAFHVTTSHVGLKKFLYWRSEAGETGRAMLRNAVKGKVWQYGVSSMPLLWPFPHFKLKSRILFSNLSGKEAGEVIDDKELQHRLRRSNCSGWRNKRWNSMLRTYLQLLSDGEDTISLPISGAMDLKLTAEPMRAISPVTTALPNAMADDAEEVDESTLGILIPADEEAQ